MGDEKPGDQPPKEDWRVKLSKALVDADGLSEDQLRMFFKGSLSMIYDGANADRYIVKDPKTGEPIIDKHTGRPVEESYRAISVDQYLEQCGCAKDEITALNPKVYEAMRRWISTAGRMELWTNNQTIQSLPSDSPPHMQKLAANLMAWLMKPLSEELRIAREVEKRADAFEHAYRKVVRDLAEFAQRSPDEQVKTLADNIVVETKYTSGLERQIEGIRLQSDERYNRLRDSSNRELETKKKSLQEIKDLLGDKDDEIEGLKTNVESERTEKEAKTRESAQRLRMYNDEARLTVNLKVQNNTLDEKLAKARAGKRTYGRALAGVSLALAGVSLALAGVLYFYKPSVEPSVEKPVPVEQIGYNGKEATVQFGDEVYTMSLKKMSEIYGNIELDQKNQNRQFDPAERKKYFDDRKDKTYRVKGK